MSRHRIEEIQKALGAEGVDGWLFYSFRGSDPIALNVLGLDRREIATRRWAYFVPAVGEPQKIVHVIEPHALDTLPGKQRTYLPWQQLHSELESALGDARRVAMQYSPMNAIPYISRVDAGTVELVRSFGVDVVSSADLVQVFEAVWTQDQLESHLYAARHLREIVDAAFAEVGRRVSGSSSETDEFGLQEFIWQEFASRGLISSDRPIVAVNAHSADPHYAPTEERTAPIRVGDFLLLDIWAKRPDPGAVYADITWTGFLGETVPERHEEIFQVVRAGRDAAIALVAERGSSGDLHGWEVDEAARNSIKTSGYGDYFIHRTGHSIHEEDHGNGANIDNLETRDDRRLMRGTCFSIEPGVYLRGEFGVRSEVDVYLGDDGPVVTGGPIQEHVIPILAR